jgi:hypothetical protein
MTMPASRALCLVLGLALAGCSNTHRTPAPGAATSVPPGSATSSPTTSSPAGTSRAPTSSAASAAPAATSPATSASGSAVPAGFRPGSVTFVSPSTGFVLGDVPCAAHRCVLLVMTHDGGRTWAPLPGGTSPAASPADVRVTKVRFATASDGWAFGPELWSTHDGGRSWRETVEPGAVRDVEAAGGVAYAVVASCAAEPCGKPALFVRTPVARDAWAPVRGVSISDSAVSLALHGRAVWLLSATPSPTRLVTSADGDTWKSLSDPCAALGSNWLLGGVAAVSASAVYLLCGGDAGAGSESKKILYSTDGGAHGTPTAADPPRGGLATGIAAASASVVAVAARSGASWVYRSGDSGHSWHAPLTEGDGGVGYQDLGFTTSTQGVAVYGGVTTQDQPASLLITRDAGATWTPVTF